MKKKKQTSNLNKYLFIALSALCIMLMVLSVFYEKTGGPFKVAANVTVIPMQQGINQLGAFLVDVSENFGTLKQAHAENKKLQEQIDELLMQNNTLQEEKYELERLKELYKLDQNYAEYEKVGAHVIGKDSGNWFSTFTIDKGSLQGIEVDMNVIAGNGLVGIVTKTGPTWSTVRSIIDDSSNVSGMVLSTSDKCIVRGDLSLINEGRLRFEQMENNDNPVDVGEQIVTSHISDKYVQGILIGYVSEVQVDSNNLTRSGYITPVVNFKNLQEVLIITKTKAQMTGTEEPAQE
ncbi:MAG: rod shape-determining protein MreC [Ruminococcus sp.]|nr:rod shape-determining protein MreC [Ruminococcus sp.]